MHILWHDFGVAEKEDSAAQSPFQSVRSDVQRGYDYLQLLRSAVCGCPMIRIDVIFSCLLKATLRMNRTYHKTSIRKVQSSADQASIGNIRDDILNHSRGYENMKR